MTLNIPKVMTADGEVLGMKEKSESPCFKCPYKLGVIKTLVNPCPQCKMTGYSTYKRFIKQMELARGTKKNMDGRLK